jgi:hypothetical protein
VFGTPSRRRSILAGLLLPAALKLVTGVEATAHCQWLEITVENAWVLHDFYATGCDAARQQAHGERVWPGFGDTVTFDSSDGPLSPPLPQGHGLRIGQWNAPPWWVCSHGWMDMVDLVAPEGAFLYGRDADYAPDAASGETHPSYGRISSVAAWGTFDGFDLASINDQPATITRTGNTFVVYIGPELAATDLNRDGAVNVPDIFAFLSLWFRGAPEGDWNALEGCEPSDIVAYLTDWFREQH